MIMGYKISIIVPVYNVEDYLRNTLDSIVSQSFGLENLEVVLVDDKSTDGSADIIREYVDKYDNFKGIFFDEGSGFPGKPRNVGLEHATAEYIMFLDSDDWLEENACEVLYESIVDEDADIVCGSFTKVVDGQRVLNYAGWAATLTSPDDPNGYANAVKMVDDPDFKLVVTNIEKNPTILGNANVWGKIFRKDLISTNNITFPEDIVAQDSVFLFESFLNARKIVFINDIIVNYNNERSDVDDKSISYVKTKRNLYGRIKAYDLMYDISKRFSKEKLFYKYLLAGKVKFWFSYHLLKSKISTVEIKDIFERYSHLFSNSYKASNSLKNFENVFGEIHNGNFDVAASNVSKLQSEHFPKSDNPIKVSVIVPVYNNEKFLKKCLDSIANQTLKEIEIICVDDGSSDNSFEILNDYKAKDERFNVISQVNSGAAIARNNGLKFANGDFVAFVDSDDWLELDALEKLYDNAVSNGSDMVLFNSVEHQPDNKLKERIYIRDDNIKNHSYFTFDYHYRKNFVMNGYLVIWSKLYSTSFLKENNLTFTNHLIFNDVQFHIKSMLAAEKISYCPHILYNYLRINQPSLQNRIGLSKKSFVLLEIMDEIKEYLIDNGFYEEFESDFIRFKLNELQGRLNKIGESSKEEFYQLLKSDFKKMQLTNNQINKIPAKNYRFFADVLTYENHFEYYYYQDSNLEYSNIDTDSKRLLDDKSKLIVDLNNEIQALKNKSERSDVETQDGEFEFLKDYIISMESSINNLQKDNRKLRDDLEKTRKARSSDEKIIESLTKVNHEFSNIQEDCESLRMKGEEQQKIIDNLLAEKNDLDLEIEKLLAENNKLKLEKQEFETSNSWKVTKPLRMINKLK